MMKNAVVALALLVAAFAGALGAEDPSDSWTGFLGTDRSGTVSGSTLPKALPESVTRDWSIEVGYGDSSPIVQGGRAFSHWGDGDIEGVLAVDLETGVPVWSRQWARGAVKISMAGRKHMKGPQATPLAADGRLFVVGLEGNVRALDLESGKLLWTKPRGDERGNPSHGMAVSPLMTERGLFVLAGSNKDGVALLLDPSTGQALWETAVKTSYSSPTLFEHDGEPFVVFMSSSSVEALSLGTGEVVASFPLGGGGSKVMTPVRVGSRVLVGTEEVPLTLLDFDGRTLTSVWSNDAIALDMSTPVAVGEHVVGFSVKKKGQSFSVNAATGATVGLGPGREGPNSHVVGFEDRPYVAFLSAEGDLAFQDAETLEVVKSYDVTTSQSWSVPVFVEGGFLVKEETELSFFRW